MVTDIYHTITKCTTCAQNRLSLRRRTSQRTLFPATEPLTDLLVDIFCPIPATKACNGFILIISDRFSTLTKCVALRRLTAISVASVNIRGCQDKYPISWPTVIAHKTATFDISLAQQLGILT